MAVIEKLRKIWDDDQIRGLVLTSLILQIFLILLALHRKYSASRFLSLALWTCYLLADYVATLAIGNLLRMQTESGDILAFWAPFLLLHLGGPDTITAYSLEDSELWWRHLLGLVVQVSSAIWVFKTSLPSPRLWKAAVPVYVAGILKFGERTMALRSGSMDCLRDSMVTPPDPGPSYAKFMEEYHSQKDAGFNARIKVEKEPQATIPVFDTKPRAISDKVVLSKAYDFFKIFKPLTVDLMLSFHERAKSQTFFLERWPAQAFKVVEIELSFVYDILYTKAAIVHTIGGRLVRLFAFGMIILSFILFLFAGKAGHARADVAITYVLLGAAIGLDMISVVLLVSSDWTFIWLEGLACNALANQIFDTVSYFRPPSKPQWSNCMSQNNLIGFCLKDQPTKMRKIISFLGVKVILDYLLYTTRVYVTKELKELIFSELESKAMSVEDPTGYKRFNSCRGEWVLQQKGYWKDLGWSVEVEFDESILLWHIATDLCYCTDNSKDDVNKEISKKASDYLLYLLVQRPAMLTAGIGKIRYGDTCAEAKKFFQQIDWTTGHSPDVYEEEQAKQRELRNQKAVTRQANHVQSHAKKVKKMACRMLLDVETEIPPIQVKGDRSKSVLFDACRLAKALQEMKPAEKRWRVISVVLVEMLCFTATNCRGYFHVKQLSQGGELITHVWFLMAHLGIGEQYRIEAGHARAKLIVEK